MSAPRSDPEVDSRLPRMQTLAESVYHNAQETTNTAVAPTSSEQNLSDTRFKYQYSMGGFCPTLPTSWNKYCDEQHIKTGRYAVAGATDSKMNQDALSSSAYVGEPYRHKLEQIMLESAEETKQMAIIAANDPNWEVIEKERARLKVWLAKLDARTKQTQSENLTEKLPSQVSGSIGSLMEEQEIVKSECLAVKKAQSDTSLTSRYSFDLVDRGTDTSPPVIRPTNPKLSPRPDVGEISNSSQGDARFTKREVMDYVEHRVLPGKGLSRKHPQSAAEIRAEELKKQVEKMKEDMKDAEWEMVYAEDREVINDDDASIVAGDTAENGDTSQQEAT